MATENTFPRAIHGSNCRFPSNNDQDGQRSVNLLQDGSDSDVTEEPHYPWDAQRKSAKLTKVVSQKGQWMRTQQQRSPHTKKGMAPTIKESPTSRALNTFSQNTSDLMDYKSYNNNDRTGNFAILSDDVKPPPQERDLPEGYHHHWQVHSIFIAPPPIAGDDSSSQSRVHTQPLGAVIAREAFPMTAHHNRRNHCVIKRLHPDGLAMRCGLQQGDWFLRPMDKVFSKSRTSYESNNDPPQLATFDEIQEWSKDSYPNYRPIRVLRKKINTVTVLQPPKERQNYRSSATTDAPPPYCILCNYYRPSHWSNETPFGQLRTRPKRAPRNHHTWCPKHKDFDALRVQKRLARTKHCFQVLGCEACHFEYQTGKVVPIKKKPSTEQPVVAHNEACLLYQDMLKHKREQEMQQVEARKKKTGAKKRTHGKRAEKKRRERPGPDSSSSGSDSETRDEDHGFEDGSIYQPPTRKARLETFAFSNKRKESDLISNKKNTLKTKAKVDENVRDETTEKGKPVWAPMEDDPWGEEGYQMGDILLFGPQLGIGHHETQNFSKQRYKVNPFEENSTYNSTHKTPAEGLSLILLKRDAMGRLPWGFQTVRDEFGHACLVESVDPCSPASSATFLGVPSSCATNSSNNSSSSSALNVNDMIVLINSKQVGGMTEVGMELELETCGSNLLLGVSRYKHAKKVASRFAEMERKMLDFMDRAARDERLMGWREVGCGDAIEPQETTRPALVVNAVTPVESELRENSKFTVLAAAQCIDEQVDLPHREVESLVLIDTFESESQVYKQDNVAGTEQNVANSDNQHSSSQKSEDSAAHDDNPQMGCVCGMKHVPPLIKTFWIQCESCDSWYHVAEKCIGFGEQQANRDDFRWSCVVCAPDVDSGNENANLSNNASYAGNLHLDEAKKDCDQPTNPTEYKEPHVNNDDEGKHKLAPTTIEKDKRSKRNPSTPPAVRQLKSYNNAGSGNGDRLGYWEDLQTMSVIGNPDRSLRKRPSKTMVCGNHSTSKGNREEEKDAQLSSDIKTNPLIQNHVESKTDSDVTLDTPIGTSSGEDDAIPSQTFEVGDLVFVENHAWAYVNNSGGIGFIQKTYLDTEGARVYDVKYPALDRTEKGIMAEYISPYSFD